MLLLAPYGRSAAIISRSTQLRKNKKQQKKRCLEISISPLLLATEILQSQIKRLWCRALTGGFWTAPCVAGKTNSEMTAPSAQWADVVSCWYISMIWAFLVCLFVKACSAGVSSNSKRPCCTAGLQACRMFWSQDFPSVDVNAQGLQVPLLMS